jgi:hypothetical protein
MIEVCVSVGDGVEERTAGTVAVGLPMVDLPVATPDETAEPPGDVIDVGDALDAGALGDRAADSHDESAPTTARAKDVARMPKVRVPEIRVPKVRVRVMASPPRPETHADGPGFRPCHISGATAALRRVLPADHTAPGLEDTGLEAS